MFLYQSEENSQAFSMGSCIGSLFQIILITHNNLFKCQLDMPVLLHELLLLYMVSKNLVTFSIIYFCKQDPVTQIYYKS